MFAHQVSDTEFMPRISEELLQLNKKTFQWEEQAMNGYE